MKGSSNILSKEELREARLRAIGGQTQSSGPNYSSANCGASSNTPAVVSPTDTREGEDAHAEKKQAISSSPRSIDFVQKEWENLLDVVFLSGGLATREDLLRWSGEGFQFCEDPAFGLRQSLGGPCGIFAAIQAELVGELLFEFSFKDGHYVARFNDIESIKSHCTSLYLQDQLSHAIVNVLLRISNGSMISLVLMKDRASCESFLFVPLPDWDYTKLCQLQISSPDDLKQIILQNIEQLSGPGGCLLFLLSAILTRGLDIIRRDMDDSSSSLIGQFGHCNQELINLLLTGRATSNVFDGESDIGGMVVRGISQQGTIGYLTQLETFRYCQVGKYLKVPRLPIWVIGSSSHFTVLFSLQKDVNEETRSEKLLSELRRCFKAVEQDECGYIASSALGEVFLLVSLPGDSIAENGLRALRSDPTNIARLRGHLQIDGEIILWSSFWMTASRLLSGEAIDDLISTPAVEAVQVSGTRKRSDSEFARRMQEEMDSNPNYDFDTFLAQWNSEEDIPTSSMVSNTVNLVAASEPKPAGDVLSLNFDGLFGAKASTAASLSMAPVNTRPRSDSEIARELQLKWSEEDNVFDEPPLRNGNAVTGAGAQATASANSSALLGPGNPVSSQNETIPRALLHRSDSVAGEDDDSFRIYHFNGLSAGVLTPMMIYRRSAVDAVGQTVTLESSLEQGSSGVGQPIEEILRTRWPGCKVKWEGPAPSID